MVKAPISLEHIYTPAVDRGVLLWGSAVSIAQREYKEDMWTRMAQNLGSISHATDYVGIARLSFHFSRRVNYGFFSSLIE